MSNKINKKKHFLSALLNDIDDWKDTRFSSIFPLNEPSTSLFCVLVNRFDIEVIRLEGGIDFIDEDCRERF